jgi:aminoglycoside phosphotransferase (APT) family kinase protein
MNDKKTADTIETPERLKFNEQALAKWMSANIEGFSGPLSLRKFSGGQSNPTYLLTTPSRKYVLRRKPPGKLLPSAHAVDREYRVMKALGSTGFPVPKMLGLCEDESVIGTIFFVMEFLEGRVFWNPTLPDLPLPERAAIFNAAADTIAQLHKADYKSLGLGDFGKHKNYFARQITRWTKQFKAAETEPIAAMDNLIVFLPTAIPDGNETTIVHGDYRLDNIMFEAEKPKALAVLDWELSTLGHPLADFSYFLMAWHLPRVTKLGFSDIDHESLGLPSEKDMIARYCAITGRDGLADLDFCMAYNMFRLAGIAQGVYARALQGNASSQEGKNYGVIVPFLADIGWKFAKKAGA